MSVNSNSKINHAHVLSFLDIECPKFSENAYKKPPGKFIFPGGFSFCYRKAGRYSMTIEMMINTLRSTHAIWNFFLCRLSNSMRAW